MKILIVLILFVLPLSAYSQDEKQYIREGNKYYNDKKYKDAEINYRKSLEVNRNSHKGIFNLGNSLYKQGDYENSAEHYLETTTKDTDNSTKAKAYHNLGNSYLSEQKYKEGVEAFKQSLRLNPKDKDTRYNLEYAKKMLAKQEQQQQDKNKDQNKDQQNKDQNKDQQNKDQNKDQQNKDQQNKDQQNKDQQNKDQQDKNKQQQQQNQQQKQGQQKNEQQQAQENKKKISKEDAQRILQALGREEQNLQKKLQKKKGSKSKYEKNW